MREPETYWSHKGPPIPEVADLPTGSFSGGERAFGSLSPGMRREVWRDAIMQEAKTRNLPDDVIARVRTATITGGLSTLDDYIVAFERADAARPVIPGDVERLSRADASYAQGEVRISAREAL